MDERRTPRERLRAILTIGLPIVGAMVSQNVLNLVDTAMVGALGDAALAAVGTGAFANFMAFSVVVGLSTGVQAMVARRKGMGDTSHLALPLNGALALVCATAVPLSALLYLLAPALFPFLNSDPQVAVTGTEYLQARLLSMTAVGMNFAFRGYWNAVEQSQIYLRTLVVMHSTNIFLNWLLIFGNLGFPALGATGAGLGTSLSTYVGTAIYFGLALRHARAAGFLRGLPDRSGLRTILRLSIPTSLQQLGFAAGFTTLFWIIGQVGIRETAAAQVLVNLMLVVVLPGTAFGIAAGSLVGQALGRRDPLDAVRWGWDVVRVALAVLVTLGLVLVLFADPILSLFLTDPDTREIARVPLRIFGLTVGLDAVGMVLQSALLGAGASGMVMRTALGTQWGLFLPMAYLVGPVLGWGLTAIWVAQIGYRGLQATIFVLHWRSGRWTEIEV